MLVCLFRFLPEFLCNFSNLLLCVVVCLLGAMLVCLFRFIPEEFVSKLSSEESLLRFLVGIILKCMSLDKLNEESFLGTV